MFIEIKSAFHCLIFFQTGLNLNIFTPVNMSSIHNSPLLVVFFPSDVFVHKFHIQNMYENMELQLTVTSLCNCHWFRDNFERLLV